ncbi:MAG: mycothione reductase [Ilumatobacteraceae bacterium]|nr:mycothione reductase [Ilumatobacteraceae bacterium]
MSETEIEQYDLIIIGAGSGNTIIGPAFDDWKIAIVEEWVFGGTCLNRGCIPTKMFVHTADLVQSIEHTSKFGVDAHVDANRWSDIRDRVFGRIDPIASGGEHYRRFGSPNITVHGGRGKFVGPRRLDVVGPEGTTHIEGRHVVIAAGARPMVPDVPGLAESGYLTSDDIMRVDEVPPHLIVVGGGFIACELAHVFGSFGSQVSIVQRSARLLMAEDDDISAALTARFAERFDLHCGTSLAQVKRQGDTVQVTLTDGTVIEGTDILVATGRVPNSDTLDVAAAGIAMHPDGRIVTDLTQATTVPGVWALGDISSPYMLKHVANHEARVIAHNLIHPDNLRHTDYRAVPHAVFTNPQIAAVGLNERDAIAQGIDIMVSTQQYGGVAYGWALEDTTSFCKLIADRSTRRLVGAHIIGHHASSLIQQLIQGMRYGSTIDEMATGQYYIHPALGELVENALLGFGPA